MGRIRSTSMLGDFNGAVGNVVLSRWRGKGVIRKKGVLSRKTKTQSQLEQQAKFKLALDFVQIIGKFLEITFKAKHSEMSGKNAAMTEMAPETFTGVYPNFALDFSKVAVAPPKGKLKNGDAPAAVSNNPGKIHFTWSTTTTSGNRNPSDKAMILAYCPDLEEAEYNTAAAQRSDGAADLDVPDFSGKTVHAWIVFITENGKELSNGRYLGVVNVQ